MLLPELTYLSFDSVHEGIGASQVVPYVERLALRGVEVVLHTFEKGLIHPKMEAHLRACGIQWFPHRFLSVGSTGGALRVAHGASLLRGADLVHARTDLAAASTLMSRRPHWVWDVRSFWADQRIA